MNQFESAKALISEVSRIRRKLVYIATERLVNVPSKTSSAIEGAGESVVEAYVGDTTSADRSNGSSDSTSKTMHDRTDPQNSELEGKFNQAAKPLPPVELAHPDKAESLAAMAEWYISVGNLTSCRPLLEKAFQMIEETLVDLVAVEEGAMAAAAAAAATTTKEDEGAMCVLLF